MSLGMNAVTTFDFNTGMAPGPQMKALYAGTISSRILASRSKEELRETFTRDIPGWATLFYVASVVENAVGFVLDKLNPSCQKEGAFSLIKGPEGKNFLKMLNPFGKHKVRSFEDIEALKKVASPENLKALSRNKAIVFAVGMLSSIAVLGMFIPWINVQITRKEVMEGNEKAKTDNKQEDQPSAWIQPDFSSKLNLTPNANLKTNSSSFNHFA